MIVLTGGPSAGVGNNGPPGLGWDGAVVGRITGGFPAGFGRKNLCDFWNLLGAWPWSVAPAKAGAH